MLKMSKINIVTVAVKAIFLFLIAVTLFTACKKDKTTTTTTVTDLTEVSLVANNSQYGNLRTDANLINGWGIAFSPSGNPWISSEGAGVSLVYDSSGNQVLPGVSIPSALAATGGHPTGAVFNGSATDFMLPGGSSAKFIFVGVDGVISGWNSGSAAIKVIDNSSNSSYTGLALANDGGANFLYAANFALAKIDVFDNAFSTVSKPFTDSNLPQGYAPFNIQNIGGQLYVTYAKVGADGREEKGSGLGYVDIYNPDGSFVKRFVSQGELNAPWGIAMAPAGFLNGNSANVILIGNFGNGNINAFNMDGSSAGKLTSKGAPVFIDGLWAITFPPATSTINPNRLYFAAGPNNEGDGLFGYLQK